MEVGNPALYCTAPLTGPRNSINGAVWGKELPVGSEPSQALCSNAFFRQPAATNRPHHRSCYTQRTAH